MHVRGLHVAWHIIILNICNSGKKEFKRLTTLDIDMEKEELKRMPMSPPWEVQSLIEPGKVERALWLALTSIFFLEKKDRLTSIYYEHVKSI